MVSTVRAAATKLNLPEPRKPWLPPMQPIFPLESIAAIPNRLALGPVDIPATQQQPIAAYSPDQGNLAIVGTSGSGKSTALRTLAISSALASDGPTHVYALDFAAGSLQMLEPLPHVAAVITGEDDERIGRVLRRLTALLDDRSRKFARANVSDLTGYRKEVDATEPRILLLVDGIGAFRETYEHVGYSTNYAMFSQLTADGRRLGLHVIVTADRPERRPPRWHR